MQSSPKDYGIVLLAGGKSSRLGQAKQLLVFKGKTLVKRAALIASEVTDKIVVVTGAQADQIKQELSDTDSIIVFNKNYEEGIASSIGAGLSTMQESFPGIEVVIFIVCDQPYIFTSLLKQLVQEHEQKEKGIVACAYGETLGTPVLFQKKYFSLLLQLKGDHGAKKIIQNNLDDVATINFPEGVIDIDTAEDYEALKKSS
jgi:molybdenum cofactor cytidylyltransferase